jgi:fatty-acyl-CoA synthase/long-chain acyl-CoA synthetase
VVLNDMLGPDEIEYILGDSRAETLICDRSFVETVRRLRPSLDSLERVVCVAGDDESLPDDVTPFASFVRNEATDESPDVSVSADDIVQHGYTGGTTGKPKGVLHTHRSRASFCYSAIAELGIEGDDRLLFTTPLPHSAGSFFRSSLLVGATSVIRSGFDAERAFDDIETHEVTWTFMVPTMIYRLLDHESFDSRDLSSLRTVTYGAAPMTPARLKEGLERLGPVFQQFYGQTEVPNLITSFGKAEHAAALERGKEERLSSAGQPCLMADVKIVDPETGEERPPGEAGEILATAPYVMKEYFELPEKTAETLTEDGWVHTGDIGKQDADGYVTLLDRMNDLVVTGGMNVYTTEVEDALAEHPSVGSVAVIGVPDEDWGEAVKALVVPSGDAPADEETILSFADDRLSQYKKPKSVEFRESFPKTPYGKIDKEALRDDYWEGAERQIN